MHQLIHYNMGSKSAIGIGNGICFKQVRDKGGGSYIDPLVRDSLVGVWIADQNTNESPTRNIIKNKIKDKGGDLELLNFGYKLNSGYGGYIEDFSLFTLSNRFEYSEISDTKITITAVSNNDTGIYYNVTEENSALYWNTFKIKVSGSTDDVYISYTTEKKSIRLYNGINTVVVPNELSWHSFSASKANTSCNITLEFVPIYEGALVTDGKDDMIVSQKTVQEMGITNKITVVSMIHQIGIRSEYNRAFNNYIRNQNVGFIRNNIAGVGIGKTGIYGYTWNNSTKSIIENILGDKDDYSIEVGNSISIEGKFTVEGCIRNGSPDEINGVAVYWTFIANKVLTTDEINQIIAYYKLDKYVTPQVIYDVKRQGLTNDTPDADWYLKDFSGNGHDMQLYNFAKKLGSGIGKYEADYSTWTKTAGVISTPFGFKITEPTHNYWLLYTSNITVPAHKVEISGIPEGGEFRYLGVHILKNGINELPKMEEHPSAIGFTLHKGTTQPSDWVGLSVEQISDYEGALASDGIDDYGKVENLPIYKDYTVAIDRAWINLVGAKSQCLSTKSPDPDFGAFDFELSESISRNTFSFGGTNQVSIDVNRKISYQSKFSYNGTTIAAGNIVDGKDLFLFRSRSDFPYHAEAAVWSYLLFPYTLSEFLLERQLKRYKLGTLYSDMVEFRPVIKSNASYDNIVFYYKNEKVENGTYLAIGSSIGIHIRLSSNPANEIKAITVNGVPASFTSHDNNVYQYNFNLTDKSPQEIDITIDEYIRFEDIVQPYPTIINLKQDGKTITWGDKLKVGSEVTFVNHTNLLPDLYSVSGGVQYNGTFISWNTSIRVEKSMVFVNSHSYKKANEPNCILAPQTLRIPNSSYKILGYIPDLTGKGNHGRLNNFAYTEESGANEDGSIRFDGKDDHITIPTLSHGGKCMLMKVNWNKDDLMLYDQRRDNNPNSFAIYIPNFKNEDSIAYSSRNDGKTYIDGVLNTSVKGSQLKDVTHNITITNSNPNNDNTVSPAIGSNAKYNAFYAQMVLYEFMLLPDVPDEEEIKELNDVMGIEGGYVESPNYYWDAYGKTNSNADRATIIDQVSKDPVNALTANNFAFNEESGYSQIVDTALFKNWVVLNGTTYIEYTLVNDTTINITKSNRASIDAFYCRTNVKKKSYYRITGLKEGQSIQFGFTNNIICTVESDGVYEVDWSLVSENYQQLGTTFVGDCNIIIEQVAQYPNGLVSDGVEDNLKNTNMLVLTDYTWIMKRKRLDDKNEKTLLHKGDGYSKNAFLFEFTEGGQKVRSFGNDTYVTFPDLISYQSKNNYNGQTIESGTNVDGNVLHVFMGSNSYPRYTKAVFYKGMLYSKTIDALSINMLKNLFEKDELIDINNPIFKKKEL